MLCDTLVHSFITAANQNEAILLREAAGGLLGKRLSSRREKNDRGLFARRILLRGISSGVAEERFDGLKERLRLEDHAFAAAERPIVHGAMAVSRELAQVLDVNLHDAGFSRAANDSVIQRASEELRKDGDEVKAHRREV